MMLKESTLVPRSEPELTDSVQDYLKAIYELTAQGEAAETNQIAERLNYRPASVTVMIQKLAQMEPPLVDYLKHHGVTLTALGRQEALRVIRRHRLIEMFLLQNLGYSWEEVHPEAERLEHAASEQFIERLAAVLSDPDFDPHGDPIPDRDLKMPVHNHVSLADVDAGQLVVVRRVQSSDVELLQYLGSLGLQPGARLQVLARVPFDRTTQVKMEQSGREAVFGANISSLIRVEIA